MKILFQPSLQSQFALQVLAVVTVVGGAHAKSSGPVKVNPKPSSGAVVLATPRPVSAYERLRAGSRAPRVATVDYVRDNHAVFAGRTVEIKGRVAGLMSTKTGRRVLLRCESGDSNGTSTTSSTITTPFEITSAIQDDDESMRSLRPGAEVRVLASVNPQLDEPLITLLAATDAPENAPLFRDSNDDNSDIIIVPPMTSGGLPLPRKSAPTPRVAPRSIAPRNVAPRQNPYAYDERIEGQIEEYSALVRRFNKKLSAAQVEEIARALLTAGYAQNMDPRFLAAIIAVESDFDIYSLSSSGAMGLGQIMPFNLPEAGMKSKSEAWNPTKNIHGTAKLLRGHMNDYLNRPDGTLLAVAAYNAGPGAVRRAGYKVPNGQQVQRYVWKVYYRYKDFAPELFK